MQPVKDQRQVLGTQALDGAGGAMASGDREQPMYRYRAAAAAQVDIQRLSIPVNRPPESIVNYLRSLRGYLDPKLASKILGCHRETLYLLISEKNLSAQRRGRRWRIDPIKFAAWLESTGFAPAATEPPEKRQQEAPLKSSNGTRPPVDRAERENQN